MLSGDQRMAALTGRVAEAKQARFAEMAQRIEQDRAGAKPFSRLSSPDGVAFADVDVDAAVKLARQVRTETKDGASAEVSPPNTYYKFSLRKDESADRICQKDRALVPHILFGGPEGVSRRDAAQAITEFLNAQVGYANLSDADGVTPMRVSRPVRR